MKITTSLGECIEKVHKYYGTETLEDAMTHVHLEVLQFGSLSWLPILELCVIQNYLPDNILDICMNYFLWKGDMKKSAEFARILRFWKHKGFKNEGIQKKLFPLSELIREFQLIEEEDKNRIVFTNPLDRRIYNYNSSFIYTGLKSLYYNGYLEKIMLLRMYYSRFLLTYNPIWEFGIRKLKRFTPYNPGIKQEWINIYFSIVDSDSNDEDLFKNILPDTPFSIERKLDLFLVFAFNKVDGKIQHMILFKHYGDKRMPAVIWRNQLFVN